MDVIGSGGTQLVCSGTIEPNPKFLMIQRTRKKCDHVAQTLPSNLSPHPLLTDQVPNAVFGT